MTTLQAPMNMSYTLNILKFSAAKKFGTYRAKFDSVCRSRYFSLNRTILRLINVIRR